MAIIFSDSFDHYGSEDLPLPSFMSGKIDTNMEPYGFTFQDDEGKEFSVHIERTEKGGWRMRIKGEGELIFAEPPRFMAYPL